MKIAIIGTGAVARALATLAHATDHDVRLGSRTPHGEKMDYRDAAEWCDVVVLAIPYDALATMLPGLREPLAGKLVIDPVNPINADWSPRSLGAENSAAEEIADLLPDARVVKAFNTVFADVMTASGLDRNGRPATTFVAGDDSDAVETAAALARDLGFGPVRAGPLNVARQLEALAHLNIAIAVGQGGGTGAAILYDRV